MLSWVKWALSFCALALFAAGAFVCVAKLVRAPAVGPARRRAARRAALRKGKHPPWARRPVLPRPCAAVLSAMGGLTAGFGMGPGDPPLRGRAHGGCSHGTSRPARGLPGRPGVRMRATPSGALPREEEPREEKSSAD